MIGHRTDRRVLHICLLHNIKFVRDTLAGRRHKYVIPGTSITGKAFISYVATFVSVDLDFLLLRICLNTAVHVHSIQLLIKLGACPTIFNCEALRRAIRQQSKEAVQVLLTFNKYTSIDLQRVLSSVPEKSLSHIQRMLYQKIHNNCVI